MWERCVLTVDMQPRRDLASTGYALANPGSEYLVLEPDGKVEFSSPFPPGPAVVYLNRASA